MKEVWKPLPIRGYEVSNLCNLRRECYGEVRVTPVKTTLLERDGKKLCITPARVMREFFPYEWIKELEDGEEATPIKGFPQHFITNRGRVWSSYYWRWAKPSNTRSYYWRTSLTNHQTFVRKFYHLHTLVGRHFLPEWEEGLFILHKDENLSFPEINWVENLWVGTPQENVLDAYQKGRKVWTNQFGRSETPPKR